MALNKMFYLSFRNNYSYACLLITKATIKLIDYIIILRFYFIDHNLYKTNSRYPYSYIYRGYYKETGSLLIDWR